MAGPQRLLFLPPLVLLLVAAGAILLPQRGSAEEGKVSLELYYESLCPYCSRFIVNHLAGIFEDGLIDAVHLRLVPYGNARVGSNSEISCQVLYARSRSRSQSQANSNGVQDPVRIHGLGRSVPRSLLLRHAPRPTWPTWIPPPIPQPSPHAATYRSTHPMATRLAIAALLLLASAAAAGEEEAGKVAVALYYESLCPYSARFVVNHLAKAFVDGLLEVVDLTLVPYGNARIHPGGVISCQHGPYECLLNTVEACAIDAWPDLDVHFSFIYCVEDLVVKRQYKDWESCFQKLGLDPEPVTQCYNSEHGHKLELEYANQTNALEPPHRYVPWVVVDGQPLLEDYENFEAYTCKAYKGTPPKACEGLGRLQMALETAEARNGVSYNSGVSKLATAEDGGREQQ